MLGSRIITDITRADARWADAFRALPVANISDVMARMLAGGAPLRPMHKSGVMAGPAFTVKTRPGDNLLVHKALSMAQPGDVIVVDAGGDLTNAIIGELMTTTAKVRGLAGFVIHGAIRDIGSISADTFPVYACGITHRGPYKSGPGEINVPINLGGMVVHPGDLVVGDEDGVLSIERAELEAVYKAASAKQEQEVVMMRQILDGTLDTAWIDQALAGMSR